MVFPPPLGLHPLALEEIIHSDSRSHSRAEYYRKHLFLRVLCHEFVDEQHASSTPTPSYTDVPRSASPEPIADFDSTKEKLLASDDMVKERGSGKFTASFIKRRAFGGSSLLPTTRVDVKAVSEKTSWTHASRNFTMATSIETTVCLLINNFSLYL
jgi:hypothetical protein